MRIPGRWIAVCCHAALVGGLLAVLVGTEVAHDGQPDANIGGWLAAVGLLGLGLTWSPGAAVQSPRLVSQVSPVDTPQSCMSLHRFGTTNDSLGSVVRSVGKSLNRLLAEDGTLLKSAHGLCLRAYRPEVQPV